VVINDLSQQISDTDKSVQNTELKIEQNQSNLSDILRSINQEDQRPLVELILTEPRLSSFFDDVVYLENLNEQSDQILQDVKTLKSSLEDQKSGLESDKSDMESAMQIQTLQKQEQEKNQAQQEQTLKLTESQYQNQLSQKKATETEISKIKNKIFQLAGLGASQETLHFGEAVILAKKVADIVGIRPAFLLAILTQESNVGQNVGQCYLTNNITGSGVKITTGQTQARVMSPARDVTPYLSIVAGVGRDPAATRLSCPMSYGWGGAMGPAQFIPSTWMSYTSRITAITGSPADPWKNNDAFLAAALYVGDYGAKNKDYDDEWKAAMIYFSGTTNKKYRFYGDNVVAIEKGYENDIATIGQ
jgi:membrane-bound lytic murein transglycosylase B